MGLLKRQKTPAELARSISVALDLYLSNYGSNKKLSKDPTQSLLKYLGQAEVYLYGDSDRQPDKRASIELLVALLKEDDCFPKVIKNLRILPEDVFNGFAQILSYMIRSAEERQEFTAFVESLVVVDSAGKSLLSATLDHAFESSNSPGVIINASMLLKECIRHRICADHLLNLNAPILIIPHLETPSFDIATFFYKIFRDLLRMHKTLAASYLESHQAEFFEKLCNLLANSANYVTRRQCLKLLAEILLEKSNFNIMTEFISDPAHLKLTMNLLRDPSNAIQFEAFHVFKVFVANPEKNEEVESILIKNKEKLLSYLSNFHPSKEDPQFESENQVLMEEIRSL